MEKLGIEPIRYEGLITAHGDKCYSYESLWEENGIPFPHGVAIFLLTYLNPYYDEIGKQRSDGKWIFARNWVVEKYPEFRDLLSMEDLNY